MFVEVGELAQFFRVFDLVERFDKFVGEGVNPFVKVFLDIDKSATYLCLPDLNQSHIGGVIDYSLTSHLFDAFKFLLVQLVLLVKINQALVVKYTEIALPLALLFRVEDGWSIVHLAIEVQITVGVLLLFLYEECIFKLFS